MQDYKGISASNRTYQEGGKKRVQNSINSSQKHASEQVPPKQKIKSMCDTKDLVK